MTDAAERCSTRKRLTHGACAAALVACVLACPTAHAQSSASTNEQRAEKLFNEAGKLASEGKYAEACPKLEESQRLDPGLGTQFNLAACWERIGRLAAAWHEFETVAKLARAAGKREREQTAKDRAAALDRKLGRLSFRGVEDTAIVIKVDAQVVDRAELRELRVDPGSHVIEASAPGKKAWGDKVSASAGSTSAVTIPTLERDAPPPVATESRPPPPAVSPPDERVNRWSTLHYVGAATAGVGVVGLALGGVFVLDAKSKQSDANCPDNVCPNEARAGTLRDAKSAADLATIFAIAGGALAVGGAVIWLAAPYDQKTVAKIDVVPVVSAKSGSLSVRAEW